MRLLRLLLACATLLQASASHAEAPDVRWSGFATLGMVSTSASDLRYARIGVDHPGAENPDFGPDTVAGLQGNFRFGDRLGAALQVISRETPEGRYAPRPSLAFLSYALSPTLTVRAGRMRVPFFMLSDTLDINYGNPWVRPPGEVYNLNPFPDLDGVDLLYRLQLGETQLELHPYAGRSDIPLYKDGDIGLREALGLNLSLTHGNLLVHLGHVRARLQLQWSDPDYRQLTSVLQMLGRADVLADLSGNDGRARFSSAGFQWDDGVWLLIGEYARRENTRYANSSHGWHLTAGRRFGNWLPFVTLARQTQDKPVARADLGDPALAQAFDGFLASRNLAQRSATLGLRWDFAANAALKTEWARTHTDRDGWGSFFPRGEPAAADMRGRTIDTLSLSLDVVF